MECRICCSHLVQYSCRGLCQNCTELMKIVADAYFWRKEGSKVQREEEPATRYLLKLVQRLSKRRHQTRRRAAWWLAEHLEYIGRRSPSLPRWNRLPGKEESKKSSWKFPKRRARDR